MSPGTVLSSVPWLHLAAAVALGLVLWRPVHDSDLFWQLRLGELTLADGLPDREPFLADKADEPLAAVAWGGQVVYALLRRAGGYPLLHVADGLLWVGALVVVARSAGRGWPAAAAVVLANYAVYSSVSTRPQTFGLLGFGLLVVLVRANWSWKLTLPLGAALLVAWQNLHPSAAVGGVWLGGVAGAGWLRRVGWGGASPWAATGLALLTPPAMAATPAGTDLFRVSAVNADVSRWLAINEWMPLWELEARRDSRPEVWVALAATAILLAWRGRRVRAEDLVPALGLAVMAVLSYRFVMFWGVAVIPAWVACLGHGSSSPVSNRGWLGVAIAWLLAVAVPTLKNPSHLADYVPHAAVERLRAENVRGTVYTHTVWAGVVIDRGYPDWKVSHDGRYYLRTKPEWDWYAQAAAGGVPVAEIEARFQPVAFVLRVGHDDGLIGLLRRDAGWVELVADRDCAVFVRPRTVPGGVPQ